MNIRITRTDANNKDLEGLIKNLNDYLRGKDGEFHEFYPQYNTLTGVLGVVIAYADDKPVGCGAFKEFDKSTAEVKRMFVEEQYRGKGVAQLLLLEIEQWITEMEYPFSILETGKNMISAINFYKKNGYKLTDNYGPYVGAPHSVCFRKQLLY